jgi:nucleotide-binding universal stress UspA family protein
MLTRVLCASDGGDLAPKWYRHAAGLAAATGGSLAIVHASDGESEPSTVSRVLDGYLRAIPYAGSVELEPQVFVSQGPPVKAILTRAYEYRADVIVCGSRRRGTVASWLLGSTTRSLLERTATPLFLVPDNDFDVITVSDGQASLHFRSVIAAVDRAESNRSQLSHASHLAHVSAQPLSLMTVIEPGAGARARTG